MEDKQKALSQKAEEARMQIEEWAIKESLLKPDECIKLSLTVKKKSTLTIRTSRAGREIVNKEDKITGEDWKIIESCRFSTAQRNFLEVFKRMEIAPVAKLEEMGFSATFSKIQGINHVFCISGLNYRIRTVGRRHRFWQNKSLKLFAVDIIDDIIN